MSVPLIGEPPWAQIRNLMDVIQRKDKRIAELEAALTEIAEEADKSEEHFYYSIARRALEKGE